VVIRAHGSEVIVIVFHESTDEVGDGLEFIVCERPVLRRRLETDHLDIHDARVRLDHAKLKY
jgi:hypothetical protein